VPFPCQKGPCFNPRAPRGARRSSWRGKGSQQLVSIHAPREGRDRASLTYPTRPRGFNPRAPRGARRSASAGWLASSCFNPRAPRGARLSGATSSTLHQVSIHAPREGRDRLSLSRRLLPSCFNPRAPRGARPSAVAIKVANREFQSTRPARGATENGSAGSLSARVSIHAPREGRDARRPGKIVRDAAFQSTRPARGATNYSCFLPIASIVSIHAPREGRDVAHLPMADRIARFQSTRPARGATFRRAVEVAQIRFQSTRPARGATSSLTDLL